MNVVFLSPHFPPQYHRFCDRLKRAGATVLGIGDIPLDELSPAVRHALNEYHRVRDMHDYDALVRACGYFTHRYGKIGRLDSLNEYWLGTEARLRDDFNIVGIRGDAIGAVRQKSKMKAKFRAADVPVARGRVVHSVTEARKLIDETGYPVVAKPDTGVGALDTYRLETPGDLEQFFSTKSDGNYILEEFISGTITSFDGLADADGKPLFYTSHVFSQGIMETVNEARHISYYSLRNVPSKLEDIGRRCLRAFDVRERFFHIEFFETAPDRYVALEVNMRPPGGFTTDMFNYGSDIDIYRMWAEMLVGGGPKIDFRRKYHCCYASRKSEIAYRHPHEAILSRYGHLILQVERVPGVFSSALGDIGYIFRSAHRDEIFEVTRFIHALRDPEV